LKRITKTDAHVAASDTLGNKCPVKVCQHILREAQNDVRSMRVATTLRKKGFDVSIIDIVDASTQQVQKDIDGIRLKHLIIPDWFTSRRFQLWFFLTAIRTFICSILQLLQSQADIYHAHELTALPAIYIVAKLRHKPLIYEAYELHLPVPYTDVGFWRPLGGLLMRYLAVILPRCQGVIAASPLYAQELSKRYHLSKVITLRNIPAYRPVAKSDRLRQHLCLGPEIRIALYQGRVQSNRELNRLVRAARFLNENIIIVMMGQCMGTAQAELEALITSEGVADRVKIIPPVPYEELLDWSASADIGLTIFSPDYSLSIRMTQPNKLFEYLMAGLPVLTSQLEAIVEIIRTYDVGQIVTSIEPEAIATAINAMLADDMALHRMSRNALEAAKNDLNWEKESLQLIHLYEDIVARLKEKRAHHMPDGRRK
jgi:glycosyltransferase involved in cell wall biosynthesis